MKFAVVSAILLLGIASAEPQSDNNRPYRFFPQDRNARTIYDNRQDHKGDGRFFYEFLSENGIEQNAAGTPGLRGQTNIEGSYSFITPEGHLEQVKYVADESGYKPTRTFTHGNRVVVSRYNSKLRQAIRRANIAAARRRLGFTQ